MYFAELGLAGLVVSTASPAVDLEGLVGEALRAHPTVAAAAEAARAAKLRADAAWDFPDPTFGVRARNIPLEPFGLDVTPMSGVELSLRQAVPWPEKLNLRQDAQRDLARAAALDLAEAKNRLAAEVRRAFYSLHLYDITVGVLEDELKILHALSESAESKYRVGQGYQQDVLRAGVARHRVQNRIRQGRRRRLEVDRHLNQLLGRAQSTQIPPLIDVPFSEVVPSLKASDLLSIADKRRPALLSMASRIDAGAASEALAGKSALPDFEVSVGYTVRARSEMDPVGGADFVSLGLGIGLPFQSLGRRDSLVSAARSERTSHSRQLESERVRIQEIIERALAVLPILEEEMTSLRLEIIPSTEQALDVTRSSYQVGRATFSEVLEVEDTLVREFIEFHRLHVENEMIIVDLAEALGVAPSDFSRPSTTAHFHQERH